MGQWNRHEVGLGNISEAISGFVYHSTCRSRQTLYLCCHITILTEDEYMEEHKWEERENGDHALLFGYNIYLYIYFWALSAAVGVAVLLTWC